MLLLPLVDLSHDAMRQRRCVVEGHGLLSAISRARRWSIGVLHEPTCSIFSKVIFTGIGSNGMGAARDGALLGTRRIIRRCVCTLGGTAAQEIGPPNGGPRYVLV